MTRLLQARFRRLMVILAILGLVYSLGVCPSGCLEANAWYHLAHQEPEHDHASSACSHEPPAEHRDCDHEPDSALLVLGRALDLTPLVVVGFSAPFEPLVLSPPLSAAGFGGPLSPRDEFATATLRAQCQLFRC